MKCRREAGSACRLIAGNNIDRSELAEVVAIDWCGIAAALRGLLPRALNLL